MAYVTSSSDFHHSGEGGRPLSARDVSRFLSRFLGMVFIFAALGLWVTPGANWDAVVLLFKTALTAVLSFGAIAAFVSRR